MWRRNGRTVVVVFPAIALVLLCSVSLILAHSLSRRTVKCNVKCMDEKDKEGLLDDEKAILKELEKERVALWKSGCTFIQHLMCSTQKLYLLLGTTKFQDRCVTRKKLKDLIGKRWEKRRGKDDVKDQLRLIQIAVKKVTGKSTLPRKLKTLSAMVMAMDGEAKDLMVVKKGAEGAALKKRGSDIVRLHKLNQQIKLAEDEYLEKIKKVVEGNVKEGMDIAKKVGLRSYSWISRLHMLKCALGIITNYSMCRSSHLRKRDRKKILEDSFKFPKYCSNNKNPRGCR
eukprot:g11275.t1